MSRAYAPRGPAGHTALYRAYDALDELLYIGVSDDLAGRLTQHRQTPLWRQDMVRLSVTWYPTRLAALVDEKRAIREECPAYNLTHGLDLIAEDAEVDACQMEREPLPRYEPRLAREREAVRVARRRVTARRLYASGLSAQAIADSLGFCAATIRADLAR